MIRHCGIVGRGALLLAPAAALVLAVGASLFAPQALSQPAEPVPAAKAGEQATATVACITCHSAAEGKESEHPFGKKHASHEYILLNEGVTWPQSDPHSTAFEVLDGKLAKSMGVKLNGEVTSNPECLSCHATDPKPAAKSEGVSCAGCHGTDRTWQVDHYQEADGKLTWRTKSPAAKKAMGLRDLRNPAVKAELCVSCHVGDAAKGRIVTHAMYAAGHPPLPPFEFSTFQNGQPRHWAHPNDEKLKSFRETPAKDRWALYRFHPPIDRTDGESVVARDHAVGAIAALRAEAALLEAEAIIAIREKDSLDFARFDCYACHHDLKSPNDRPKRGEGKQPPGRPPLRASIGLSASIVAEHALASENDGLKTSAIGFAAKWEALQAAAQARPFGDSEKVRDAAQAMSVWCNGFLKFQEECSTPLYSKPETARLAEMIRKSAVTDAASDPESAMVLMWAYRTLTRELGRPLSDEAMKDLGVPLALRDAPSGKPEIDFVGRAESIRKYEADPFRKAFGILRPPK